MSQNKKRSFLQAIWSFLISVRLTIFLLIILAAACILGTVIPQNMSEAEYLRLYSSSTYNLIRSADCIDLYHSWWFIGIIAAFAINLIACTCNRIPRVVKLISRTDRVIEEKRAENLLCVKKASFKTFSRDKREKIIKVFERFTGSPEVVEDDVGTHFFHEKGRFSYLSFFMIHVGFLVIIAGTMLGYLGFKGYLQLFEGDVSDTVTLRKSYRLKKLPFKIRCDKFEITFYDNKMPKDYRSTLTVIENNKKVLTKTIEVNDPLIYRGIYFYQSSYGIGSGRNAEALIGVRDKKTGKTENYRVKAGQSFQPEGSADRIQLSRVIPDFAMDESGKIVSRSSQPKNPAALLTVYPHNRKPYTTWVFVNYPSFHRKTDSPYEFSFIKLYPQYYTGMQVTKDPGVWVVWSGCILVVLGLYLTFFMSHKRVWLTVKEQDGGFKAVLAGTSNRNKDVFSRDFEDFFKQIRSIGEA